MAHAIKDDVRKYAQKTADETGISQYFFQGFDSEDWYFTSKPCPAFHSSEYSEIIKAKEPDNDP